MLARNISGVHAAWRSLRQRHDAPNPRRFQFQLKQYYNNNLKKRYCPLSVPRSSAWPSLLDMAGRFLDNMLNLNNNFQEEQGYFRQQEKKKQQRYHLQKQDSYQTMNTKTNQSITISRKTEASCASFNSTTKAHIEDMIELKLLVANQQATINTLSSKLHNLESENFSSRNKQCWCNSGDSDCCSKDQEKCNKKAQKKYQLLEAKMKNLEEEIRNLPSELNQSKERESRMQKSTMALSLDVDSITNNTLLWRRQCGRNGKAECKNIQWHCLRMLIPLQTTPYCDEDSVEETGKQNAKIYHGIVFGCWFYFEQHPIMLKTVCMSYACRWYDHYVCTEKN